MTVDVEPFRTALRPALAGWLPHQGWFDADADEIDDVVVTSVEPIADGPLVAVSFTVVLDGGPVASLAVLALADQVPEGVDRRSIVGELPGAAGPTMAYDVAGGGVAAGTLAAHVTGGAVSSTGIGAVDRPWMTRVDLAQHAELVLYRRVVPEPHPDVELTSVAGAAHLCRAPVAVWRRDGADLAAVRRNARRGDSGADLAVGSITELLERRCRPEQCRHDLVGPLTELGRSLAEVHVAFAAELGVHETTGTELASTLAARAPRLDDDRAERVSAAYGRLLHADDLGRSIRVHGSLDLGAVERTRGGWVLGGFGRPALRTSPLVDVASLLHELDVVAERELESALADVERAERGADEPVPLAEQSTRRELALLAEAWAERCGDAVIAGYTSHEPVHRLLPVERISRDALLALFEMELRLRDAVVTADRPAGVLRLGLDDVVDLVDLSDEPARPRW